MRGQDTYKEVKTFVYPNAIVRVHIPDLTEEERERRMNNIKKATAEFMMAVLAEEQKNEESKNCNQGNGNVDVYGTGMH